MTLKETLSPFNFSAHKPVVCAVSGGVDSMVLLHALKEADLDVVVAHVNHQLREDASADESLVKEIAAQYGYPFESKKVHLNPTQNTQNEGHQKRLGFYKKVADKYATDHVLLAHHQDDQLEHFFIQVIRGFSLLAWGGMSQKKYVRGLYLVRPFLEIPKSTLETYALTHHIRYRHDASNDTHDYLRNRIRHRIMPWVKRHVPELIPRILNGQSSLKMRVEAEKTQYLTAHRDSYTLAYETFQKVPFAQQKRFLQYLWQSTSLPPRSDGFWTMCCIRLREDPSNVHFQVIDDWYLTLDYGILSVVQIIPPSIATPIIDDFGKYFVYEGLWLEVRPQKKAHVSGLSLELCYNKCTFPLMVKTPQRGDKLTFDYGHKKINQWFKDVKIPWGQRHRTLIIETHDHHLAVLHPLFPKSLDSCTKKVYIYEVKNAEQ